MHQLEKQTMLSSLMAIRNQLWRASDQNLIHCNAGCTNNHQGSILATARQNTLWQGLSNLQKYKITLSIRQYCRQGNFTYHTSRFFSLLQMICSIQVLSGKGHDKWYTIWFSFPVKEDYIYSRYLINKSGKSHAHRNYFCSC